MVLLVGRKYQIIKNLTAGNSRIISKERVDQPGSVFKAGVVTQDKFYCLAAIKYPASISDNTVYQLHALPDLCRLLSG
jgi:hypothetical protein